MVVVKLRIPSGFLAKIITVLNARKEKITFQVEMRKKEQKNKNKMKITFRFDIKK